MRGALIVGCRSILALACLGAGSGRSRADDLIVIDVAGGRAFHREVFGRNAHASAYLSEGYGAAFEKDQKIIERVSVRGVAGGIAADSYDWRLRRNAHGGFRRPDGQIAHGQSTLELLRAARDHGSSLIITVNQRGLGSANAGGEVVYADTSTKMLATMAADWVRYANRIVPKYRQGDSIDDPDDRRVLDAIDWSGPDFRSDKLLAPGEPPVPKVTYWEIGNEVNFFGEADEYRDRYHEIAAAMTAADPSIKIGPNVTGGFQSGADTAARFLERLLQPRDDTSGNPVRERVDFISYHPYGYQILGVPDTDHAAVSRELNRIKANQLAERDWVKAQASRAGRDPDTIELLATEWNSSTYDNAWRMRQWNGLGVVETVMSFAEMGLSAAHFWVWPAYIHTGAEPSQYLAFEALTRFGGDTLVAARREENLRLYVTRDRQTGTVAVWGMNFRFGDPADAPITVRLAIRNLPTNPGPITLMRLAKQTGPTDLLTTTPTDPNQPTVGWITTNRDDLDPTDFQLTINPAEIAILVIEGEKKRRTTVPSPPN